MEAKDYYLHHYQYELERFMDEHGHDLNGDMTLMNPKLFGIDLTGLEHRAYFASFFALPIMIDELMFTHFPNQYSQFREVTNFPKSKYGLTWLHANPWAILTRIQPQEKVFIDCAEVFLISLHSLFKEIMPPDIKWEEIENTILIDPDIDHGKYGKLFKDFLTNQQIEAIQKMAI